MHTFTVDVVMFNFRIIHVLLNHHQSKIAIYRLQRWGCGVNSLHDAKILQIPYYTRVLNSNDSAIETFSIKLQKHKIANTDYFTIVYIYPKSKCEILKLYVFLAFYLGFTAFTAILSVKVFKIKVNFVLSVHVGPKLISSYLKFTYYVSQTFGI